MNSFVWGSDSNDGPNDTKELNETSVKTPVMMKRFSCYLASQYMMSPKDIMIAGIAISGKKKKTYKKMRFSYSY